jgi:hypothetical protein
MNGPVFVALGILLLAVVLILGLTPIFLVPVFVLVVAGLLTGAGAAIARVFAGNRGEPAGVPPTEDAAYDPTRETAQRTL